MSNLNKFPLIHKSETCNSCTWGDSDPPIPKNESVHHDPNLQFVPGLNKFSQVVPQTPCSEITINMRWLWRSQSSGGQFWFDKVTTTFTIELSYEFITKSKFPESVPEMWRSEELLLFPPLFNVTQETKDNRSLLYVVQPLETNVLSVILSCIDKNEIWSSWDVPLLSNVFQLFQKISWL